MRGQRTAGGLGGQRAPGRGAGIAAAHGRETQLALLRGRGDDSDECIATEASLRTLGVSEGHAKALLKVLTKQE